MYSHIASNDSIEPLNFYGGWLVNGTIAAVGGSYAGHGKSEGQSWIDIATNVGLLRLVGVDYELKSGTPPANDASYVYFAVYPKSYLKVSTGATVNRVFSHDHQTSFDNVYGDGSKPTVGQIIGKRPIDLLATNVHTRVDGSKFADTIVLNDAGSVAYSNKGKDTVEGGLGADEMYGGEGKDYLFGGGGADYIQGDNGNDRIYGGGDNDTARGSAGKDFIYGGDGEDSLSGQWQNDRLYGDADHDVLNGGDNNDRLYGGSGEDDLKGGRDNDRLYGRIDNDRLKGQSGNDKLYGEVGQDALYGGSGKDKLYGGDDNDAVYGGADNDKAFAGIGQDTVYGGSGNDQVYGEDDNDWLYGGSDNDKLFGGIANDFLYGEAGRDKLDGGHDNDRLDGGDGPDVLTGGIGADTFVFSTKLGHGNIDRITDFEVGSDGIWLSAKVFKHLPIGPLAADNFVRGSEAGDTNDHVIYDAKKGVLSYDANGSKKGGEQVFAKVDKNTDLHNSDFYVV